MPADPIPSHHGPKDEISASREYPNETVRLLHERGSVRSFADREIPEDVLRLVLEAGIHAPTGGNLQPYSIVRIEDFAVRQKLAEMCWQAFIGQAPVALLFCIDWHRIARWAKLEIAPYAASNSFRHFWIAIQDTTICAQNISTAADAVGLGSVHIGTVLEHCPALREMFALPDGVMPVVLLCLGYPKSKPKPRKKLGVEHVVHRERYVEMPDEELLAAFEQKYAGQKVAITPDHLETIRGVCQRVHGDAFAKACEERIQENGYIRPVQRYFGLHYRADSMAENNEEFVKLTEDFGFGWFRLCERRDQDEGGE